MSGFEITLLSMFGIFSVAACIEKYFDYKLKRMKQENKSE